MKALFLVLFLLITMENSFEKDKMLIIFFSHTGNTETFANYIQKNTNITSFKIVPATPYPDDFNITAEIVQEERNNNSRPEIKDPLTDISQYNAILLGYPIWYSHIPNIVITQLEKLNFKGKTIYPFNTHGSSGVGNSISEIKQYAPDAKVMDGYPIKGSEIANKEEDIIDWLDENFDLDENETFIPTRNNDFKIKFKNSLIIFLLLLF
jgi:flavodoxin